MPINDIEPVAPYRERDESAFCNTYGGLGLIIDANGAAFLSMDDCTGTDYYGPLTPEETAAYRLLAAIPARIKPADSDL